MDRLNSARLYTSGRQYFEAAKTIIENSSNFEGSPPLLFLIAQSIELFIKAFLRGIGFSEPELKKLGHNLTKIYAEALEKNLNEYFSPQSNDQEIINLLNESYCSRDLQYVKTGMKNRPRIELSIDLAKRLNKNLLKFCADKRKLHD